LRYLAIHHPEKARYDFVLPGVVGVLIWAIFIAVKPTPPVFGVDGLLSYLRELLGITLPFLIGALAGVAMGAPGPHFDRRPPGSDLTLDGETLTMRQFVCYLLGYLCFLSLTLLISTITASLLHKPVSAWLNGQAALKEAVLIAGLFPLFVAISALLVTVLWALYFLTDIVNRPGRSIGT
jgi:hypothetical protein